MSRPPREQSESAIYHVMLRGNEKRDIFLDDEDRVRFIDILRIKRLENGFELYAFCLMNNHVHLLINEMESSIARIMKCINVSYAFYFNKKYNRVGHLFQDRFRSEVIDMDNYLLFAARYIHNNPVKAGIVDSPEKYEWSSYGSYLGRKPITGLVDTSLILEMFSGKTDIALNEFVKFTTSISADSFIDVEETVAKKITTRQEAISYLDMLLYEKGVTLEEIKQLKGRIKGTIKHELVIQLKHSTTLSCRDIGNLIGLNKSTVQELK